MINHIIKHQSFITLFLSFTLLGLLILSVIYPGLDLANLTAIITGWLGIIIGFFFNKEFSEFFREKYKQSEKERVQLAVNSRKTVTELEGAYSQMIEKYEEKIEKLMKLKSKRR